MLFQLVKFMNLEYKYQIRIGFDYNSKILIQIICFSFQKAFIVSIFFVKSFFYFDHLLQVLIDFIHMHILVTLWPVT